MRKVIKETKSTLTHMAPNESGKQIGMEHNSAYAKPPKSNSGQQGHPVQTSES